MDAFKRVQLVAATVLPGLVAAVTYAGTHDFTLTRHTVDGGGVTAAAGGEFELAGTIGQPDAASLTGGAFELSGGFWFPLDPHDCNTDGGVDLYDYGEFESCMTGPGANVTPDCVCFDVDHSGTVDLHDFAIAQVAFTGA